MIRKVNGVVVDSAQCLFADLEAIPDPDTSYMFVAVVDGELACVHTGQASLHTPQHGRPFYQPTGELYAQGQNRFADLRCFLYPMQRTRRFTFSRDSVRTFRDGICTRGWIVTPAQMKSEKVSFSFPAQSLGFDWDGGFRYLYPNNDALRNRPEDRLSRSFLYVPEDADVC